jgi:hypothetical protein
MSIAAVPNIELPLTGFANTIFRGTWLQVSILGFPSSGYRLTAIGLIVLGVLAFAVSEMVERLTGRKFGGLFATLVVVVLGAILVAAYARIPYDFTIEGIPIIASMLGALIVAVFLVLMRHPKGAH